MSEPTELPPALLEAFTQAVQTHLDPLGTNSGYLDHAEHAIDEEILSLLEEIRRRDMLPALKAFLSNSTPSREEQWRLRALEEAKVICLNLQRDGKSQDPNSVLSLAYSIHDWIASGTRRNRLEAV